MTTTIIEAPPRMSRRTRKRVFDDSIILDYDDAIDQLERDEFEEAEERKKEAERERKKKREEEPPLPFLDLLPPEVVSNVLSFVSSPRVLLSLSMCNKTCRNAILATPTMVIRAAVFSSDHRRKKAITTIVETVQARSIHTPSTARLLRLLNATQCERTDQCYDLNVVTHKSGRPSYNHLLPFGLCLCSTCLTEMTTSKAIVAGRWERPRVPHERLVTNDYSRRMLPDLVKEHSTGEAVGPLVGGVRVRQIMVSYKQDQEKQKQAFASLFEEIDNQQNEGDKAEELVDAYITAVEDLANLKAKKDELAAERDGQRAKRKREMGEPVLERLRALLEDHAHRDIILAGDWNEWSGIFRFSNKLSMDILGSLLTAPSTAKEEKIQSKVQMVVRDYEFLFAKGFGTGNHEDFLCDLAGTGISKLGRAVFKRKLQLPGLQDLYNRRALRHLGRGFVEILRMEGTLAALFPRFLTVEDRKTVFLSSVAEKNGTSFKDEYKKLAKCIWDDQVRTHWGWGRHVDYIHSIEELEEKFDLKRRQYLKLSSAIKQYLGKSDVTKFLKTPLSDTHRRALQKIFELKHGSKALLNQKDFKAIFRLHHALTTRTASSKRKQSYIDTRRCAESLPKHLELSTNGGFEGLSCFQPMLTTVATTYEYN
ncbi:expressed unknown protein [Seminavis robusta]|uniref:F-box domain-containing protein n=1 Tax=Seminavis robusta TaxID=568900 RepID=A0A9N8HNQ7_9STRA|nr:expressed unknown protein [Seminavis robusta]|eukprot:Sro1007_g230470.1 n/a (651) ;mRNA; r:34681-36801